MDELHRITHEQDLIGEVRSEGRKYHLICAAICVCAVLNAAIPIYHWLQGGEMPSLFMMWLGLPMLLIAMYIGHVGTTKYGEANRRENQLFGLNLKRS